MSDLLRIVLIVYAFVVDVFSSVLCSLRLVFIVDIVLNFVALVSFASDRHCGLRNAGVATNPAVGIPVRIRTVWSLTLFGCSFACHALLHYRDH